MRHVYRMQAHTRPDASPRTDGTAMPRLAADLDYFRRREDEAELPSERELWRRLADEIEDYLEGDDDQEGLF